MQFDGNAKSGLVDPFDGAIVLGPYSGLHRPFEVDALPDRNAPGLEDLLEIALVVVVFRLIIQQLIYCKQLSKK